MAPIEPAPGTSRIEAEVRRVQTLLRQRHYVPALAAAEAMLTEVPENRDVLYLVAVSKRYLGRIADALRVLERLEKLHPDFARQYQERGHCYRAVGKVDAAIAAYRRAVELNNALLASWRALEELCRERGDSEAARTARIQAQQLAALPAPVLNAAGMLAEGDVYGAEALVRSFLTSHGDHIEAMRLLAQIGVRLDVLDDAEFLLESVLVFAPQYHAARYDYSMVLSKRHKHDRALAEADKLVRIDPSNSAFRTARANALVGLGRHEEALGIFRELAAEAPHVPGLHVSIAHALKTLGRQQEAIDAYRLAAGVQPSFGDAYWSLANLKTYRFTDDELCRMREQEDMPTTSTIDRYHLCFALGKGLEDRGEYQESFRYYDRGNALKKPETHYSGQALERSLKLQAAMCTREFFASRQAFGCDCPDPIFIVGLPRSGSTLLEQILASHSKVEGTTELANIPRLVQQLDGRDRRDSEPRYPALLADLSSEQFKAFGERYIRDTRAYRGSKPFFIDKMPNNFRHIALIHLMLPNAKIIDARRDAMACCFSNFKQLFASGQEFTYSLQDIGRYYRAYVEIMAHWDSVLPGRILRIRHEEVVDDLEGNVRRLLEYCGLEYEPACVEFYKTERSVRTASSEQVRQPIFKEGRDQWRHYEEYLEPLRQALGPLAVSANASP